MKKKEQRGQLILIFIGIILIISTYFYYPYLNKKKFVNSKIGNEIVNEDLNNQDTSFENVEYQGLYDFDKSFTLKSKKAHILEDDPNVLYLESMHVTLYLADGRVVNIVSKKGKYNKITYDCFFEENVRATDGETEITSNNLDLLATKNSVKVYNNVELKYPTGSLKADKIDYDFETKYFKVSMFNDEAVKMKVFK